jgi:four helix bundle protein
MGEIKTYRDLIVWQKSMTLVTSIYQATRRFPKEEIYGLSSQLRRAAVSLPNNIAEGHGRNSTRDYVHFLAIATGSLYELQTQIMISFNLGYLDKPLFQALDEPAREIERMIGSLVRRLRAKGRSR